MNLTNTKSHIKSKIADSFLEDWQRQLLNTCANPIIRTYNQIKSHFALEPYLKLVKIPKYRNAIAKLRSSSHILEIERGRYTKPNMPIELRVCSHCNVIEDEGHFLINGDIMGNERSHLFRKITEIYMEYLYMYSMSKFIFLMRNTDANILTWIGTFIHDVIKSRLTQYPPEQR